MFVRFAPHHIVLFPHSFDIEGLNTWSCMKFQELPSLSLLIRLSSWKLGRECNGKFLSVFYYHHEITTASGCSEAWFCVGVDLLDEASKLLPVLQLRLVASEWHQRNIDIHRLSPFGHNKILSLATAWKKCSCQDLNHIHTIWHIFKSVRLFKLLKS